MHLGTAIRSLREKHALSQSELADRLGVTQGYISQVERSAGANIRLSTLDAIATALETTTHELVNAAKEVTDPRPNPQPDAEAQAVAS